MQLTLLKKFLISGEIAAQKDYFIAPHYKNSFTFYPVLKTFLPFSKEMITSNVGHVSAQPSGGAALAKDSYMSFQPSQKIVVERLHEQIIQSLFIQSFSWN